MRRTAHEALATAQAEDIRRFREGEPTLNTLREIRAEVDATLERAFDSGWEALADAAAELAGTVDVQFNSRFTRRLGDANLGLKRVRFSTPLWKRAGYKKRQDTVRHEVAHLLTAQMAPRAPAHGHMWKMVCRIIGASGERCHHVPSEDLRTRVPATCTCGNITSIGKVRAGRIRNGTAKYHCTRCRGVVALV